MNLGDVLVELGGLTIVAAGTWFAARWTSKGASRAAEITADAARHAAEVSREDAFIQGLSSRLGQLEQLDSQRVTRIATLETRVSELEANTLAAHRTIEALRRYVMVLRDFIKSVGHKPPSPPRGI